MINIFKILTTGVLAFVVAFVMTPLWTHVLYRYKIGIRIKETGVMGDQLTFVNQLHKAKAGTPTMGGFIVWGSVLLLIFSVHLFFPFLAEWMGIGFIAKLDFLRRSETWLPLFVLVMAGMLGLIDDYCSVRKIGTNKGGGMRFAFRFWWLFIIAGIGAWWFYSKLGWDMMHIPAVGDFNIGWWYIPLFIFVILYTAISSNETDGLDGLNAGVLIIAFTAFTFISYMHNKVDLASFCAALSGALLAFLWFNVYPARFFMGDTGAISLGTTLGVVALLTNSVIPLLIIIALYGIESGSVVLQLISKRFFGRKIFLAAPLHHHFEASGWPEPKVVMRAWIFTAVMALIGLMVAILGMGS